MNSKQKVFFALGVLVCTVTAVTASTQSVHTPLYRIRMEQASSEMHFLPTEANTFTYTAEKGCSLDYGAASGIAVLSAEIPAATGMTCEYTCDDPTCPAVCLSTFRYTCTPPCHP